MVRTQARSRLHRQLHTNGTILTTLVRLQQLLWIVWGHSVAGRPMGAAIATAPGTGSRFRHRRRPAVAEHPRRLRRPETLPGHWTALETAVWCPYLLFVTVQQLLVDVQPAQGRIPLVAATPACRHQGHLFGWMEQHYCLRQASVGPCHHSTMTRHG